MRFGEKRGGGVRMVAEDLHLIFTPGQRMFP